MPSAPAAYDLHRPSSANPRCRLNSTSRDGPAITVTPPDQGHRALTRPQRLRRKVQGDQRRRARGVHRQRRTLQPEAVGDPTGHDAGDAAGEAQAFDLGLRRPSRSRTWPHRRTPRCPSRGATRGRSRRLQGPPRRPPASVAAAGRWPALRAARSRRTRRRNHRRRRGNRRRGCRRCRDDPGPGRTTCPGPSRGPSAIRRPRPGPARPASTAPPGVVTPPGYRQLIPTIANGSSAGVRTARAAGFATSTAPPTSASSNRTTAIGDGWSNTSVDGNRRPLAWVNRFRSSTAPSESNPRSLNARSGSIASPEACPSTAATCARTSSSTTRSRSLSGTPANRCASEPPAAPG